MNDTWEWLMKVGAKIGCHQRADRSFFYRHTYQFPVCARCTGVIIGYVLAVCSLMIPVPTILCLVFCGIMFLDWLIQYLNICVSTNPRRLITGILGGFGLLKLELIVLIFLGRYLVDMIS